MRKYLTIVLVSLAINTSIYAQVTIGSNVKPVSGSLLDIKEFENVAGGATATKGLLLPRVVIADVNILQIAPDSQSEEHTGTIVYAVSEDAKVPEENEDVCASIPIVEAKTTGLMLWTGSEWKPLISKEGEITDPSLPSWVHPAVKLTKPDQEGNSYTFRYFGNTDHQYITLSDFILAGGTAANYQNFGYWMTENLRSKKYGSNHPGVELSLVRLMAGDEPTSLLYGYPQHFPGSEMQIDTDFIASPSIGLLYSPAAIAGAMNGVVITTPNMQGICPDGWFLPTKSDWDGLTAYLETPEQRALYTTYDTQIPIVGHEISRTLTTACSDFMNKLGGHVAGSRGKHASDGAFGLVAVGWGRSGTGKIENNTIFEYPETPDSGSYSGVPYRAGSASLTLNGNYYSFKSQGPPLDRQMISVRCRTNVNPNQ